MKVICDSIGSVPSHSNAPVTECSMCGGAIIHDDDSCEPCPWNKNAKCIPVDPGDNIVQDKAMKKTRQYLPFILWSISTITLTGLAFVVLPIILFLETINNKKPSENENKK